MYHGAEPGRLRLRFFVGDDDASETIARIKEELGNHQARLISETEIGSTYAVLIDFTGDLQALSYAMEHLAKVVSIGESLDIIKDIGSAHVVDDVYDVDHFSGIIMKGE